MSDFVQQSEIHQLPSPHLLAVMDRAWSYPPPPPPPPPNLPPTSAVSSRVSGREEEGRKVRKARTDEAAEVERECGRWAGQRGAGFKGTRMKLMCQGV